MCLVWSQGSAVILQQLHVKQVSDGEQKLSVNSLVCRGGESLRAKIKEGGIQFETQEAGKVDKHCKGSVESEAEAA